MLCLPFGLGLIVAACFYLERAISKSNRMRRVGQAVNEWRRLLLMEADCALDATQYWMI